MKKLICLLPLFALLLTNTTAQATFKAGDMELATGVGIFSTFAKDGANTIVPPVSARLGVRVSSNFSLAGYIAYSSSELQKEQPNGTVEDISNQMTIVGLRAAAHANPHDKVDFYGGVMMGYNIPNIETLVDGTPKSVDEDAPSFSRPVENNFAYSAFVGAAYYHNKHLGVFVEAGYGISILSTGLTVKF